jgi:hypothetical protein
MSYLTPKVRTIRPSLVALSEGNQPSSWPDCPLASTSCFAHSRDALRKSNDNYSFLLLKHNSSSRRHCLSHNCFKQLALDFLSSQSLMTLQPFPLGMKGALPLVAE